MPHKGVSHGKEEAERPYHKGKKTDKKMDAVDVKAERRVVQEHSRIIQNPSNGGGLPKPIMEGLISQGIKSSTQAKYIDGLIDDPSSGSGGAEKAPVVAVGSAVGAPEVRRGGHTYETKARNPKSRGGPDGVLLPVGQN